MYIKDKIRGMEEVLNHNRGSKNANYNLNAIDVTWITAILDETLDYLEIARYANSVGNVCLKLQEKY